MSRSIRVAMGIWTATLILSRLIGLLRDSALGHTLGVSPAADAYQTAFRIPDWFMLLLAGGALSIVFIPIFSRHIERGDEERGWRAFSNIANFLSLVMLAVGAGLWIGAPTLAPWIAPGFDAEQHALLVRLTRIILPAQAFHVLGGLLSASLLSRDQHGIPAVAPLLYSGGIIAGGLIGGSAEGFAWGVLAGAFAGPFLLPLVAALRTGLKWQPILDLRDADLREYLAKWIPVLLGGGLALLDDTLLARFGSMLDAGSIALLGYAKTLMRAPMGIFGASMAFAAYPTLTRLYLEGRTDDAYRLVTEATRKVLFLAFGSQVALTVAAPEIGTIVYGTHRIAPARMTELGLCLAAFSLALAAWSAQVMLARSFYARGRGWVPARIGLGAVVLCSPLYYFGGALWGAVGLASASSLAVTVSVVALQAVLRREFRAGPGYFDFLRNLVPLTAAAIAAGWLARQGLGDPAWTRADALARALALGAVSGSVFLGGAWWMKLPEIDAALAPLRRRLARRRS